MYERAFLDKKDEPHSQWWHGLPVSSLAIREPVTISTGTTIQSVLDIMHARGFDQIPVISDDGYVDQCLASLSPSFVRRAFMGMATMCEIMAKMSRSIVTAQDPASKAVTDKFITVGIQRSRSCARPFHCSPFRFDSTIVWRS